MSRAIRRQDSPVADTMDYYDDEMTRDNYIATNYVGMVSPDDTIPNSVEDDWPEQFRRKTLLDTEPASSRIQ